jgi:hypothetical protein
VQTYLKALYGAATAALSATSAAYVQGGGHIGWAAGLTIAGAGLGALAVVWVVPNAPKRSAKGAG